MNGKEIFLLSLYGNYTQIQMYEFIHSFLRPSTKVFLSEKLNFFLPYMLHLRMKNFSREIES